MTAVFAAAVTDIKYGDVKASTGSRRLRERAAAGTAIETQLFKIKR